MAQKFWIGVAAAEHIRMAHQQGFCAFSHGKAKSIEKLHPQDRFIYYATKERFEDGRSSGAAVQAFMAAGEVLDAEPALQKFGQYEVWTRPARYEPLFSVPVKPFLHDLSFIKNPQYWGMAFRRSLFEISQSDYNIIMEARCASG